MCDGKKEKNITLLKKIDRDMGKKKGVKYFVVIYLFLSSILQVVFQNTH